jgi:hypothetical protein
VGWQLAPDDLLRWLPSYAVIASEFASQSQFRTLNLKPKELAPDELLRRLPACAVMASELDPHTQF